MVVACSVFNSKKSNPSLSFISFVEFIHSIKMFIACTNKNEPSKQQALNTVAIYSNNKISRTDLC